MFGVPYHAYCGCFTVLDNGTRQYLPQVELESHTTILATTSRTVLKQKFTNPLSRSLKEVSYTFPLYDGVSIGGFKCNIGDRVLVGVVKERNRARADYQNAVSKGQTAGLLVQSLNAGDVFTTTVGNVPAGHDVVVEITYLGELKNDAETDGVRFTIPTQIAPRYGTQTLAPDSAFYVRAEGGIKIIVDVELERGTSIRGIQSASHPIAVTVGRTSTMMDDDDLFEPHLGSSTLALGSTELDKDFVIVVQAKGQDTPRALLETHPSLPNQRALMTTLIPKFNIPNEHPEIVFVVDRSGSMGGKMHLVAEAVKVFLKSLPTGVKFNICSFGTGYSFLFEKSRTYDSTSVQIAMDLVQQDFDATYGGTEMLQPVQEVIKRRYKDVPLEVMLLTDGEIWDQEALFSTINEASKDNARFFTLGIGPAASSSLVEGIARGGRGFAQWVNDGERMDKGIVRMLKAALTPHIEYKLEVKYKQSEPTEGDDDFELIESFEKSMKVVAKNNNAGSRPSGEGLKRNVISLFDPDTKDEPTNPAAERHDHLVEVLVPNVLQTPHDIPELYSHSRSTIYLLLGPDSTAATPTSVILCGTCKHGDLEVEIPVQEIGAGTTIHQVAAKKAMQELEEGRGWLTKALDKTGQPLKTQHESQWDLMLEREAVRLGTTFQVGGKFCSFVAVQEDVSSSEKQSEARALADYQVGLMVLEQQNQSRRFMGFGQPQQQYLSRTSGQPRSSALFGGAQSSFGAPSGYAAPYPTYPQPVSQVLWFPFQMEMQCSTRMPLPEADDEMHVTNMKQHFSAPAYGLGASNPFKASSTFGATQTNPQPSRFSSSFDQYQAQPVSTNFPSQSRNVDADIGLQQTANPSLDLEVAAESFHLDFSTLDNADVLENFDFDSFLCQELDTEMAVDRSRETYTNDPTQTYPPPLCQLQAPPRPANVAPGTAFASMASPPQYSDLAGNATVNSTQANLNASFAHRARKAKVTTYSQMEDSHEAAPQDPRKQVKTMSPLEKMQYVIVMQTFRGDWTINKQLLEVLSNHPTMNFDGEANVFSATKKAYGSHASEPILENLISDALGTALAIAWLEKVMKDEEEVWEMVVKKARNWLEGHVGKAKADKLIEAAKTVYRV